MRPPDLDRVWETFVRIGPLDTLRSGRHFDMLRTVVGPTISALQARLLIGWYSFLIHSQSTGVPTQARDPDAFWHIRLELMPPANHEALLAALPTNCEMTRQVPRAAVSQIPGLTQSKLRTDITDAWRVIGEQSEWLLRVLLAYKDDLSWDDMWPEIRQYLHYYANMTQLLTR